MSLISYCNPLNYSLSQTLAVIGVGYNAFKVARQATYHIPEDKDIGFGIRLDPTKFEKKENPLADMASFMEVLGVRKDVVVLDHMGETGANGINLRIGKALIAMNFSRSDDPEAFRFIVMHELSHIKYNDNLLVPVVGAVTSAGLLFFSSPLAAACGLAAQTAYTLRCEIRADDTAIQHATNEELLGGRRVFQAMLKIQQAKRDDSFFNRIRFSQAGEDRLGVDHPSLNSRIAKIERELSRRGYVQIDEVVEAAKRKKIILRFAGNELACGRLSAQLAIPLILK